MKIYMTMLSAALVVLCSCNTASAADNAMTNGAKKVGAAIVWPFKQVGKGLKAMGNGMKKMVGKG